jgi:hypothetical protein
MHPISFVHTQRGCLNSRIGRTDLHTFLKVVLPKPPVSFYFLKRGPDHFLLVIYNLLRMLTRQYVTYIAEMFEVNSMKK